MIRRRVWLGLILVAAGLVQVGHGAWILAKAVLAQGLLDVAWTRTLATGTPSRPWPWADTRPVARLTIPRLGRSLVVLAGASGEALAFGPGHVDGSARPGAPGNAVIAGHRDTHFDFLPDLAEGDLLVVEDLEGRRVLFEVVGTAVVDARDAVIRLGGEAPALTLVACWPFDAAAPGGPLRYLVSAQPRLNRLTTNRRTSAPTVAITREPTSPPVAIPRAPNR